MSGAQQHTSGSLSPDQERELDAVTEELDPLLEDGSYNQALSILGARLSELAQTPDADSLRGALLTLRAEVYVDIDDNEAAIEDVRQAMECGFENETVHAVAGWAFYNLEKFEAARKHFQKALALEPDEVPILVGHALVLQELDELDQARAELAHAIHVDPQNAELYAMRSDVHVRMKDMEAAERDLQLAREIDVEDPDYALALTRLLMVMGRVDEALEVVDQAVGDEADLSLEALLLRSHLRLTAGRTREARADAMRASNQFSDEAFALVQLAHVQLAEGNVNLAMKAAERAVKLDPSLPDAYMVRGAALQMSGRADEAREDFQRASQAPAELPMFLLGPAFEIFDTGGFNASLLEMLGGQGPDQQMPGFDPSSFFGGDFNPAALGAAGLGGMGGLGGDPMKMLGQLFDDSGNIRGPLKPLIDMALKNAPKIMKNIPPGLLSQMGGLDPSQLDDLDLANLSSEQIEEQMREFYKMMQGGNGAGEGDEDE